MKHTISLYKGLEHCTTKEFVSFEEAMTYLDECSKLSEKWTVHYVRKAI